MTQITYKRNILTRADLGFSRGGGGADFQEIFENFVDFVFKSTESIF